MSVTVIVGEQRGDEGKGRFVDMLAQEHDIVARFNGGNNAGHTVVTDDGRELALHGIPSGIAYEHTMNVIGRGCLINATALLEEKADIESKGFEVTPDNLMISSGAHLILPHHKMMDAAREAGAKKQGSTGSGIAPVAGDKYMREGLRAEVINNDLDKLSEAVYSGIMGQLSRWRRILDWFGYENKIGGKTIGTITDEYTEAALQLGPYITDTDLYVSERMRAAQPAHVLAEGAQAFWLDVDHGMWPYVTSSSTTAGGVTNGIGVPPQAIDSVVGVSKLVPSHVGGGPFVTEIHDKDLLDQLHGDMSAVDAEKGTTTGRIRRLGHLDLPAIRRSQMINGTTEMAVTKLDWVPRYGETVLICTSYTRTKVDELTGAEVPKTLLVAPDAAYKLDQCTPNYEDLPTWDKDIQHVRRFRDLPTPARDYIRFIEDHTARRITMIGVGPQRDQVIDRR